MAVAVPAEEMATGVPASIVEVGAVSKFFPSAGGKRIAALKSVNLSVSAGRFTTLLGPSGCGKTTLLRTIGGFEDPDEGRVLIDGVDMTHTPPYRRPVNTVFQQYALFPHLTVAGNVAYGLEVTGVPKSEIRGRVMDALSLVRLQDFAERRISQISGGQQQRVALARSLVLKPKILLLDEPLAALDRKLRKEMQVELKRLQHEIGIAFLCVTHDQEEALSMSDTVVVMNEGRIEQIGAPRDIYDDPESRFVAQFVGEASILACRAEGRREGTTVLRLRNGDELLTASETVPTGDVVAMIRPERMWPSTGAADMARHPTIGGTVVDSIYLGNTTRIELDAGSGERMFALLDGADAPPAQGSRIRLSYDPRHVRVASR